MSEALEGSPATADTHQHPKHLPVLLDECLEALNIDARGRYVDGTYGRGGHTNEILAKLGPDGRLLVLDRDPSAIEAAEQTARKDPRLIVRHSRLSDLHRRLGELGWQHEVAGILFDLGVSSPQLESPERGFSFQNDGPLDMRMDPSAGATAAQWLAGVSEKDLADALYQFGEERWSRRIAKRVVEQRRRAPLTTTSELADLVRSCHPRRGRIDPATRTFQALRIVVNDELGELQQGLASAVENLKSQGRLAVVAFHSLEDRVVKRTFRGHEQESRNAYDSAPKFRRVIKKAILASPQEVSRNPRARSARLRILERVA
ncbi:MAG: 16S rRNA (cytosine(1402)-N(4))-methyltransferase RsmH [Pseudomonadota bacterium]